MAAELFRTIEQAIAEWGFDLRGWFLGWARVLPAVVLVPAFGLRALPGSARAALGIFLGLTIAPTLHIAQAMGTEWAWPWLFARELVRGLPVAIMAASALWVASMVGGLVDNLCGAQDRLALPNVETGTTPLGAVLSMLVAVVFLETGGPARLCEALAGVGPITSSVFAQVARALVGGIEFAVAVAVPLVVASLVVEVTALLVARAAQPAPLGAVLAPLRTLVLLGTLAVLLDRLVVLLVNRWP